MLQKHPDMAIKCNIIAIQQHMKLLSYHGIDNTYPLQVPHPDGYCKSNVHTSTIVSNKKRYINNSD